MLIYPLHALVFARVSIIIGLATLLQSIKCMCWKVIDFIIYLFESVIFCWATLDSLKSVFSTFWKCDWKTAVCSCREEPHYLDKLKCLCIHLTWCMYLYFFLHFTFSSYLKVCVWECFICEMSNVCLLQKSIVILLALISCTTEPDQYKINST